VIDHGHALVVLTSVLSWKTMETGVAPQFAHKERPRQQSEEATDLAGPVVKIRGGKASNAGRPRLSMRLIVAMGARSFTGNPYDGHILAAQMEQTTILLQDLKVAPWQVVVGLGLGF